MPIFRSRARNLRTFLVGLPLQVRRLISLRSFAIFLSVTPDIPKDTTSRSQAKIADLLHDCYVRRIAPTAFRKKIGLRCRGARAQRNTPAQLHLLRHKRVAKCHFSVASYATEESEESSVLTESAPDPFDNIQPLI